MKKFAFTLMTAALLTPALLAPGADAAEAAGCKTSGLSSTRVKNDTCRSAAYAYKQNGRWYQAGNWVGKKTWSYNWYDVSFVNPGVLYVV